MKIIDSFVTSHKDEPDTYSLVMLSAMHIELQKNGIQVLRGSNKQQAFFYFERLKALFLKGGEKK